MPRGRQKAIDAQAAKEEAEYYAPKGAPGNAIDEEPNKCPACGGDAGVCQLMGHVYPIKKNESVVPAKLKDSDLPTISAMEYDDMDAAKELISEAVMYQEQMAAVTEAMKFTKERLASLAQAYGMKHGMRHGQTAIRVQFGQTRKSLDKGMLLLNGCPAEAIAKSYKDSKPFDVVTVVDMGKAMGNGTADD